MTHEMKTPLAGVKALLESLREGRVPSERLLAIIAEIFQTRVLSGCGQ